MAEGDEFRPLLACTLIAVLYAKIYIEKKVPTVQWMKEVLFSPDYSRAEVAADARRSAVPPGRIASLEDRSLTAHPLLLILQSITGSCILFSSTLRFFTI
jgi:hypothetical protein